MTTPSTQRIYWGVATPPGSIDASFVQDTLGDQGTALASTQARTINSRAGVGQRLYYAFPASWGGAEGDFVDADTGFAYGFCIQASLTLTTAFGTQVYNVWGSSSLGLGETELVVSA